MQPITRSLSTTTPTESLVSQLIYTLSLRWIPNNPNNPVVDFQMSSSEYLLQEEQTQERLRSCRGSVKLQRVPPSTGETKGYVDQFCLLASLFSLPTRFDLTHPWMLVTIVLFSSIAAKHRISEASTVSTTKQCSRSIRVMFFTTRAELSRVAQRNSKFCRSLFDASVVRTNWVLDYTRFGMDSSVCHQYDKLTVMFSRYCVPMDNQRPQLDLKFYKDICPDRNGTPLRTFVTVPTNAPLLKFPSLSCLPNMTSFYAISRCIWLITQIKAPTATYLKWRRNNSKGSTCNLLVTMLDTCDQKVGLRLYLGVTY